MAIDTSRTSNTDARTDRGASDSSASARTSDTPRRSLTEGAAGQPGGQQDDLLDDIFTTKSGGQALADGPAIDAAGKGLIQQLGGLRVPQVNAKQAEALSGHGSPGQRQRSEAYQRLLQKRPILGQKHDITVDRMGVVIGKDRAYDGLTLLIEQGQQGTRDAIAVCEGDISGQVLGTLGYVGGRLQAQDAPDQMFVSFLPIALSSNEFTNQGHQSALGLARSQQSLKETIARLLAGQTTQGQINQMTHDAGTGADLPGSPAPAIPAKPARPAKKKS